MKWRSLAAQAASGARRGKVAEKRLAEAYMAVFGREDEDVEIVLADLADYCGFYQVAPPGSTGETLQYANGLRASFGRLFSFLSMSDDRLQALESAARAESETNEAEGYF